MLASRTSTTLSNIGPSIAHMSRRGGCIAAASKGHCDAVEAHFIAGAAAYLRTKEPTVEGADST